MAIHPRISDSDAIWTVIDGQRPPNGWGTEVKIRFDGLQAEMEKLVARIRAEALTGELPPYNVHEPPTDYRERRELLDDAIRLADMLNSVGLPEVSGVYAEALREGMAELVFHYRRIRALEPEQQR